ncbi:alanine dehydrogenase [Paraflavitalea soli]|uniref:Alanine dehydrogenase n=1 Tax=Paraflavitalea soli TaxID=2315862 RepID=A0A3B7MK49_9BACT|nr:NAD(P)-dependent oxidoreductase [Paraflavitalea soli]AXY74017.1 alanine dehydrogenase [Paraflavitalea soli]
MIRIGLIREGKTPADNRVALTPAQCKWIHKNSTDVQIIVQSSPNRCFSDKEYRQAGIAVQDDVSACDVLFGIKEVPVSQLIPGKTYLFFSHTRKKQPYNQALFHAMMEQQITLIDYECLEHEDGQRIIGFGFFAGVVGAHNGMMAWGHRTGAYDLVRVHKQKSFHELIHTYFGLRIPAIKIAVTGSGRVAHGILEIMNLMGVHEVEPDEYLQRQYTYPVYTQLKGADLYRHRSSGAYNRTHFHEQPEEYIGHFLPYAHQTDVLMNGIYWDTNIPRLFEEKDILHPAFRIQTIADITDDAHGSVPINLGDQTIDNPVYGVDKVTLQKTAPYLPGSIDVMAVGNLPNELPRDASRYFGEQLIKYILEDLLRNQGSQVIQRATMLDKGKLTTHFDYLHDYAKER